MDIKEYISSGVLETYVLGVLSREEALEVERLASIYPEIREEISAIEESMNSYAEQHAVSPPKSLRNKVFVSLETNSVLPNNNHSEAKIIQLERKKKFAQYFAAASLLAAIISVVIAVYSYSNWKNAENRLLSLEKESTIMANQANLKNSNLQGKLNLSSQLISLLEDSSTSVLQLKATDSAANYLARVVWSKKSDEVFIRIENLPVPPEDKQYQLWALDNGVPVDAGVFEVNEDFQKLKNIGSAQAFAVTLEKKGGSPTPTLEAMYLIGQL